MSLTIPAAGIGVWEGAAVVHNVPGLDYYVNRRGVVTQRHHEEWAVWLSPDGDWPQTVITANERGMSLDLTHQPTRLMVLVRLAEHVGLKRSGGGGGPRWLRAPWVSETCWAVDAGTTGGWDARDIPALADLDLADDTCLPDGARVVDVRALAIVCRHVFGGPS